MKTNCCSYYFIGLKFLYSPPFHLFFSRKIEDFLYFHFLEKYFFS